MKKREIVKLSPTDLKETKGNPRMMSAGEMAKLMTSIREHGYLEIVVVDETNNIIAGHQRVRALLKLGFIEPIDVLRITGYNEPEKKAISIALNKITGEWNIEKLEAWFKELKDSDFDLSLSGFDAEELEEMEIEINDDSQETGKNPDEAPLLEDESIIIVQPGDIIRLGEHILLCGDSTSAEDVARLMGNEKAAVLFTDPPYNINYAQLNIHLRKQTAKDWTKHYCPDNEDNLTTEGYREFLHGFLSNAKRYLIPFGHYYVWFATSYFQEVCEAFQECGIPFDKVPIIWKKQTMPISWVRYKRNYEPCLFGWDYDTCLFAGQGAVTGSDKRSRWFGPPNERAVWEIDTDPSQNYVHPTQKPVALAERAIKNSSLPGEVVLDLFGGSGSTLIACEINQRKCRMMEKSPYFCQTIIERWLDFTGNNEVEINGQEVSWNECKQCA